MKNKRKAKRILQAGLIFVTAICLMACVSSQSQQTAEELVIVSAGELREVLVKAVSDAGRLQQMLAITDKASIALQAAIVETGKLRQEQSRLNLDYNASPDDFRRVNSRLMTLRKESRSKILSSRQALAQLATDTEWKKIVSHDLVILSL